MESRRFCNCEFILVEERMFFINFLIKNNIIADEFVSQSWQVLNRLQSSGYKYLLMIDHF